MTTNQKHAKWLRLEARYHRKPSIAVSALLAGAQALEGQGRWRAGEYRGQAYLIPVGREKDWLSFADNAEPGEYTAIVPEWAKPVPDDVVITGVELP